MNRTKYEGYTNSETFTIGNHVTNDSFLFEFWIEATKEYDYDELTIADKLKDEYENIVGEDPDDLTIILANEALAEVDWYDIAGHLVTIAKEQDEYKFRQTGEQE